MHIRDEGVTADQKTANELAARHRLAHDLQSPIRAIAIYAELMERSLQEPSLVSADLEKFCHGIIAAAGELETLVDGFAPRPS